MAKRYKDLTGKRFGRLVVLSENGRSKSQHVLWKCLCGCGNIIICPSGRLNFGHTKSCGCLRNDNLKKARVKHGLEGTNIYKVWQMMKDRCLNHRSNDYCHYGGRGISICEEWLDFKNFHKWAMSNGYEKGLTIDREDNDGNYCPENCRWSNIIIQRNNTSRNHFIEFNGERKTIAQWSRIVGINPSALRKRILLGWSVEKALTTKLKII